MEDLGYYQKKYGKILANLYECNIVNIDSLQLIEDCLEILTELNQLRIEFVQAGEFDFESFEEVLRSMNDFEEYLNRFSKEYNV